MKVDRVFDFLTNKFHVLLASATQATVLVFHFKTGHDIGVGVQNSLYAYYAFLAGHAFTYQRYPDKDDSTQ